MGSNPLFTIVIPTHNRAKLLAIAIQSVIDQQCSDWEIQIVDDGSTDNTKEVVHSFKQSNIHYHFQNHQERSTARNKGIEQAKGTYICFLDDDDYFLSHHLSVLQKSIAKESFPIAILRTGMWVERKQKRTPTPLYPEQGQSSPALFFLQYMAGMHTLCFHCRILQTLQFDVRWMHFQDTHLLIRALLKYPFFQLKDYTCVYVRYENMGSLTAFQRDDAVDRTANNVAAIRDLFLQGGQELKRLVPPDMEAYLVCQKYLDHANGALQVDKRALSWNYFKQSISNNQRAWLLVDYAKYLVRYVLKWLRVF